MFCEICHKLKIIDSIVKRITKTKYPRFFCSKCYVELVLAKGNCNKCDSETTHRVKEYGLFDRMKILRGNLVPEKECGCGGIIKLNKIANKKFMTRLNKRCFMLNIQSWQEI